MSTTNHETSDSNVSSYNTIKRQPRRTIKYSTRMTLSFALTAVMTAVLLSIFLALVWEGQFQTYTRANMQRMAQQTADGIAQRYNEDKTWSTSVLDFARATSDSMPEVGMRITNAAGEVLYDDTNGGVMTTARGARNAKLALPLAEDSVVSADVFDDTGDERVVVGTVTLWSVSSDALLTKSDSAFRTSSYAAIVMAALLAIGVACVIGYFTSRCQRPSRPKRY